MKVVSDFPVPAEDLDSAPFWSALREHRLLIQQCQRCGTFRFPPRTMCNRCSATATTWTEVSGHATLVSWIVTHQVFHPAFSDRVPYAVLLVQLVEQDDLLLYGGFEGDHAALDGGVPLIAGYDDRDGGITLLQWRRAPSS
jgi:uncharacterized OB-fold protein